MQRWLQRCPLFYLLFSAVLFARSYLLAEGMLLGLACAKLAAWGRGRLVTPFLLWLLAGAASAALSADPLVAGHAWSAYLSGGLALLLGAACGRSEKMDGDTSMRTTAVMLVVAALVCLFGKVTPGFWPVASNPALQSYMPLLAGWQQSLLLTWLLLWAVVRGEAIVSPRVLAALSVCAFLTGFLGGLLSVGAVVGLGVLAWQQPLFRQQLSWRLSCAALLAGIAVFSAFANLHQSFLLHADFLQQWLAAPAKIQLIGLGPDQFSSLFFWREEVIWHPEMTLALAGGWGRLLLETGVVGTGALVYLGACWGRHFPETKPLVAAAFCQFFFLQWLDIAWCYYSFLFLIGWTTGRGKGRAEGDEREAAGGALAFGMPVGLGIAFFVASLLFPVSAGLLLLLAVFFVLAAEPNRPWTLLQKGLAAGWALVMLVNILYSHAPLVSLKMWQVYLSYPLFFASGVIFCALRKKQSFFTLVPYLLLFAAAHAAWQAAGYGAFSFEGLPGSADRVQGQASNPILFADYLLVLLVGLFMLADKWSIMQWLAILGGEFALVLTGTRGAWLAWLAVLFLALFFSWKRFLPGGCKRLLVCGVAFLLLLGGVYSLAGRHADTGLQRLATVADTQNDHSNLERLHMWSAAFDMGRRQFVTGVGLYQFADVYFAEYRPQQDRERVGWQNPHNDYAGWFAETGLPGLLLYLLTVGVVVHKLYVCFTIGSREQKHFAAVGFMMLGGLLTFGLSYSVFTVAPVMRLSLFLTGYFWQFVLPCGGIKE